MNRWLLCTLLAASFGLTACQSLYQDDRAVPQPARAQTQPAPAHEEPVPPPPPPKPVAKRKPPAPTSPPAAPEQTQGQITVVGMSRPDLIKALGDPAERTDRNAGQAWVYRAGSCSLEVLFLFDVVRNEMFVIDRKLNGTDGSARGEQQCLQRIKAEHAS